jgi:DNA transformation protein
MDKLTDSPNIGATLAEKLENIGVTSLEEVRKAGSKDLLARLAARDPNGVCLLMLYALEGAVQGIRWHGLSQDKKEELKSFYNAEIISWS